MPTDRQGRRWPSSSSGRRSAGDPRITGVESAEYSDAVGEGAVATTTGIRAVGPAQPCCYLMVQALAADGDETQTGCGLSVGREPADLDVDEAAADAVAAGHPPARRHASPPTPAASRSCSSPRMTATFLGIVGGTLNGEAVLKGRSPFADRVGEAGRLAAAHLRRRPHRPRAPRRRRHDGEGLATRRNELVDGGVLQGFLHNTYTGRRSGTGVHRLGRRGGF